MKFTPRIRAVIDEFEQHDRRYHLHLLSERLSCTLLDAAKIYRQYTAFRVMHALRRSQGRFDADVQNAVTLRYGLREMIKR